MSVFGLSEAVSPDEMDVLRRCASKWAIAFALGSATIVGVVDGQSRGWAALCGVVLVVLYARPLNLPSRVIALFVVSLSVVCIKQHAAQTHEALTSTMYAIAVFTLVLFTRTLLRAALAIVVLLLSLTVDLSQWLPWYSAGRGLGLTVLTFPSVLMFGFCASWRRAVLAEHDRTSLAVELEQRNRSLVEALEELEELGAARERLRIGQDIHDRVGHCLTSCSVYLETIERITPAGSGTLPALERAREATAMALHELRACVAYLRDADQSRGLRSRIARLTERFPLHVSVDVAEDLPRSSREIDEVLLRCLQEALTNTARHARANTIGVHLIAGSNGWFVLTIRDDGVGCSHPTSRFGLAGMRERVARRGGRVEFWSRAGRGFRVQVELPAGEG